MKSYEKFAPFYDAVMGDRTNAGYSIYQFIREYRTAAQTVLDLACGTGSILEYLSKHYKVTGLDISPVMLSFARKKLRGVPLHRADMTSFQLDSKFDVIVCCYDSINHLLKFSDWGKTFSRVYAHLNDGGLFIFDINTEYKLKKHVSDPPWVHKFGNNLLIMDITADKRGITNWNIKVFERRKRNYYQLHEETIKERSYPYSQVKKALLKKFLRLQIRDFARGRVSVKSERLVFICEK